MSSDFTAIRHSPYRVSPSARVIRLVVAGAPVPALVGRVVEEKAHVPATAIPESSFAFVHVQRFANVNRLSAPLAALSMIGVSSASTGVDFADAAAIALAIFDVVTVASLPAGPRA